jgi:uncharacterized protein YjbJ (UPF0337 family)
MTSSDPDVLRRQIEDTRRELSSDVDALNEKVSPGRVVDRRMTAAKGRMTQAKEKVMGSAHDTSAHAQGMASNAAGSVQDAASNAAGAVQDAASNAAGSVQDAASNAAGAVQQAPDQAVRQTQGNPLAAGLIAFGAGWLISSLMPASEKERQLAQQAESSVKEHSDQAKEAAMGVAKETAKEVGTGMRPAVQHAAKEVASTAMDATSTVKDEGKSAAQDAKGQAQESKEKVKSQRSSS